MPRLLFRRALVTLTILLFALAAGGVGGKTAVWAQGRLPAAWTASVTPNVARAGETVTVTVTAKVKAPYHIYSMVPVPPPGPRATTLTVSAPGLKPAGSVAESAPKALNDANFGKVVNIHEGEATFTQKMTVDASAQPAPSVPLTISVHYMACDDKSCISPRPITVAAPPLVIESGAGRPEWMGAGTTSVPPGGTASAVSPAAPGASANPERAATGGTDGLGGFILAAFGAGLLALVTPCVFPLVPVTFAFFTKQAQGKAGGVVRLAGVYCIGIVLSFTAIGVILAATVGASGANRLAASPWTNLIFATLFVVFGLSLLEIVEIRPPAFLQKYVGAGQKTGGTLGVLGMGLTFVVSAFTCTAPFIGTVLVAASSAQTGAQWLRPIVGMAAFASALALPFFVLALFPSLLAKLPKSGAWLSTVKGTMGFLELAAALKFLSNTDLVWQWRVLTEPVLLTLWTIIAFSGALWLLGVLRLGLGAPSPKSTWPRKAWAGVFALAGFYCLWGLSGRPVNPWVAAFLPPTGYGAGGSEGQNTQAETMPFLPTLTEGLAQAKAENKPIFIDFTGYACTNCRYVEKYTFPDPDVQAELQKFVRVRLYTDGGQDGDKNQTYQEKNFGDIALPLYAVLTPDGKKIDHVDYTVAKSATPFVAFLRSGYAAAGGNGQAAQTAQAK